MSKRPSKSSHGSRKRTKSGITSSQFILEEDVEASASGSSLGNARTWDIRPVKNGKFVGRRKTTRVTEVREAGPQPATFDFSGPEPSTSTSAQDIEIQVPDVLQSKKRKQKLRNDSTKMSDWLENARSIFVDEMMRHKGLGTPAPEPCYGCGDLPGIYRCLECMGPALYCQACIVDEHCGLPLHRVQKWETDHFQRSSLYELGLVVDLCHHKRKCPSPIPLNEPFTVIDMNGLHLVKLQWCGCDSHLRYSHFRQLIRCNWYPATLDRPRTAFSFDILDTFHKLTLQGKLNLYDFYLGILQKTDNCGRMKKTYRYHELNRCVRQWRNLKIIIRGGGAHEPGGTAAISQGSLAVECPACPQPGRNMPIDLSEIPEEDRWLYALFLAIDANFRLKLKARGIKDPEMGSGWAYFVEQRAYEVHVRKHFDDTEIVTCGSTFHAVNDANSKFSKGYSVTGVGAVVCARHNFLRPNGVGDLQKGERHCNMDYIILSALLEDENELVDLSYDVICSWAVNFEERMQKHYPDMKLSPEVYSRMRYFIPKKHLPGHGAKCRTRYSFNWQPYVGRTHGETVEQEWSHINGAVLMTREMGSGARHAALDDHWGGWNWLKLIGLEQYLFKSLRESILMRETHRDQATRTTALFPASTIATWISEIKDWQADHTKPDPYAEPEYTSTQAQVRQMMAEEDARDVQRGIHFPHKVSAAVFVRMGLEIEEHQRRLSVKYTKRGERPPAEKASLQEQRNTLKREIDRWREIQAIYMPGVAALRGSNTDPDAHITDKDERPETTKLLLPSGIPASHRENTCVRGVVNKEVRLRTAQLQDALVELCRARRVRKGASLYFDIHVAGSGQRPVTRHQGKIATIDQRISRAVKRYRNARDAMLQLQPNGEWETQFYELKDEDNRGPGREIGEIAVGEGTYTISWIWLAPGVATQTTLGTSEISIEEVNEGMRVEWARTLARADRWTEEVKLIVAEMERVLRFFEWKAEWWLGRKGLRSAAPEIMYGLDAYANSQAAMFKNLATKFAKRWVPLLEQKVIACPWAQRFLPVSLGQTGATSGTSTSTSLPPSNGTTWSSSSAFDPSSLSSASETSTLPQLPFTFNPLSPPFVPAHPPASHFSLPPAPSSHTGLGTIGKGSEVDIESDGSSESGESSGAEDEKAKGPQHASNDDDDDDIDLDCS